MKKMIIHSDLRTRTVSFNLHSHAIFLSHFPPELIWSRICSYGFDGTVYSRFLGHRDPEIVS